jgi:hypothetical protein
VRRLTVEREVTMGDRRWSVGAVVGAAVWCWLGIGAGQAGVILPTDPATLRLDVSSPVSLSLLQRDDALPVALTATSPSRCSRSGTPFYRDVTDCYLPEVGKSVFVVINGSTETPALVPPGPLPVFPLPPGAPNPFVAALTTSAYPGQWINVGADTAADAVLAGTPASLPISATTSVTAWELTPRDGGMMAVLQVGTRRFIVPGDGTAAVAANGIPDVWEGLYTTVQDPSGDVDTGPTATSRTGDGLSTFDEYRGALVAGKHERLNPLQKNLFLFVVTGQCATATTPASLLLAGGYPTPVGSTASLTLALPAGAAQPSLFTGLATFTASSAVFTAANVRGEIIATAGGRARIVALLDPARVLAEVTEPFGQTSIAAGAWQFTESILANVYSLLSAAQVHVLGPGPSPVSSPEWVDLLARYTDLTGIVYTQADTTADRVVNVNRLYGDAQKGIRVIECLDDSLTSPYGFAIGGIGSPNVIGNVILYTKRMVNNLTLLISSKAPRKVRYSPMLQPVVSAGKVTDWLPKFQVGDGDPASPAVRNFIITKAMQFYTGMEIGHSVRLADTAPNHPHFPVFSGDAVDAAITSKPDKLTRGFNTFYIPSVYGVVDQAQLVIK